jgi:uncharacterized protein (TIGR03084 family)
MVDIAGLVDDLRAEGAALDRIIADVDEYGWATPTPSEPWSIKDQIAHLAYYEEHAFLAMTDPDGFGDLLAEAGADPEGFVKAPHRKARSLQGEFVLGWWRRARELTLEAAAALDPATRILWFGPSMKPASFLSARIMETWAHGQDVADGLGTRRASTDRLRHIAHLAVNARPYSYVVRGLSVPGVPVGVELVAPSGGLWRWHPGAEHRVSGPAEDFCLVTTQRRHVADTDLLVEGPLAEEWMSIAQAFAGPPGPGRAPGQFRPRGA